MIRLDKYLADMGIGRRSEVKKYIRGGRVTVAGKTAAKGDLKLDPAQTEVTFDGKKVVYQPHLYVLLHKPAGYITATKDANRPTVLDLIEAEGVIGCRRQELFPVGRLDIDTEGLLLLTNDGALAHDLLSPRKHIKKTYFARTRGIVTSEDVVKFEAGIDIGEKRATLPAELKILKAGPVSEVEITICEGKYHQIKRMFAHIGKPVLYLKRISMGSLHLDDDLAPGAYRMLTETEISELKRGGR